MVELCIMGSWWSATPGPLGLLMQEREREKGEKGKGGRRWRGGGVVRHVEQEEEKREEDENSPERYG